jgi:hypothetical protein
MGIDVNQLLNRHRPARGSFAANQDAIGCVQIGHRRSFGQELRIGENLDTVARRIRREDHRQH